VPTTDGRHARSERTRTAVAEAMLDCFEDGLLRPAAKEVAEDNMEALIEQASELQIERVVSQLPPLAFEGTRDERVAALVARTSRAFELTAPVRRAALLLEPFSQTIREQHAWLRAEIRRGVRRVFAEELEGLSEYQRRDRVAGLSVAAATRTLSASIHGLLRS